MGKKIGTLLLSLVILFLTIAAPECQAQVADLQSKYQAVDKAIITAWEKREKELIIYDYQIKLEDFYELRDHVEFNNTEYFFVEFSDRCTYVEENGFIYSLYFQYNFTNEEIDRMIIEFDAKCSMIFNAIPSDSTVEEKLLFIHDFIASRTSYDESVYEGKPSSNEKYIYNAYGCIVKERAVCEGISEAFKYLCKRLGIECYLVTSLAMRHEWNMVKIGNNYYHIDITQDAPVFNLDKHGFHQSPGDITHRFFLLSDAQIKAEALGTSAHYSWDAPFAATDSKTFENAFWDYVLSPISYVDGFYYYIDVNGSLVKYNYKTKELTEIYKNKSDTWTCSNYTTHIWEPRYSKAVKGYKGKIYFTTVNGVNAYDPKTGQVSSIYTRNGQGFIYAIMYKNDNLHISVRNDEEHFGEVHYFYYDLVVYDLEKVGDCNSSGKVDVADLLTMRKYLVKSLNTIDDKADINGDNVINIRDLSLLRRKLVTK